MMCKRHEDALEMELELRGLLRPTLVADADITPLLFARQIIIDHATNFSGKASVKMLAEKWCPICFVNEAIRRGGRNPGLTVDAWVEDAAEEALENDIALQDKSKKTVVVG